MSNTLNAIIQNAVPKCKECISGLILLSYNVVGSVLIAVCSKRMIETIESYPAICDRQNKGAWRAFVFSQYQKLTQNMKKRYWGRVLESIMLQKVMFYSSTTPLTVLVLVSWAI